MSLIDRHIIARFAWNFVILFLLLYVFAVAIDLILNLDRFVDAARKSVPDHAGMIAVSWRMARLVFDFQGPRLFQFYAFLHGMVAIGAMGFTLAQMHRHRELVAVMAAGLSLHRVSMPFIVVVFALNLVQLVNQELVLPVVAPLLLRDYSQIGRGGVGQFPVRLTADGRGHLVQAPWFDPATGTLTSPTFIERNDRGIAVRRTSADRAVWDSAINAWRLHNARVLELMDRVDRAAASPATSPETIQTYSSDITPGVLIVRRHGQFASMLSMAQIRQMLRTPGVTDDAALKRHLCSRFASVLVNFLVLLISLPAFLLREPANLLVQSVWCAALTLPAMIGAAIGMMVNLPGIAPAVGVFLPVLVLIPVALARVTMIKT